MIDLRRWVLMEEAGESGGGGGSAGGEPGAAADGAEGGTPAGEAKPAESSWLDGMDAATRSQIEAAGASDAKSLAAKYLETAAALKSFAPPETADGYELPVPEGESPEFAKAVAPLMHKAGLSGAQAKALAEGWNELQAQQRQAAAEAAEAAEREANALAERQEQELRREWGDTFDGKVEMSRRAIRAGMASAGLSEDAAAGLIDSLEKAHGFGAVHKFFAVLGAPLAEATAHGMGSSPVARARSFYDKSNMNP